MKPDKYESSFTKFKKTLFENLFLGYLLEINIKNKTLLKNYYNDVF